MEVIGDDFLTSATFARMRTGIPVSAIFLSFCRTIAIAGLDPKMTLSWGSLAPDSGGGMSIAEFMLVQRDRCIRVSIRRLESKTDNGQKSSILCVLQAR